MSSRAWTDSEPVASQPAPDSAVSTRGARTPERERDDGPRHEDDAEVGGGVAAEPADRPDVRGREGLGGEGGDLLHLGST